MMFPTYFYCLPFVAQALLMSVDEFYFHRRRGLPAWEVWGHPFDTLTALLCITFLVFVGPSPASTCAYIALCILSGISATKDEFVHQKHCTLGEQWLHSVLFMLHPTVLFCSALLWQAQSFQALLRAQAVIITLFMIFQIVFWGWRTKAAAGSEK